MVRLARSSGENLEEHVIGTTLGATIEPKLEYTAKPDMSEGGCEYEEKSMGGLDLSVH